MCEWFSRPRDRTCRAALAALAALMIGLAGPRAAGAPAGRPAKRAEPARSLQARLDAVLLRHEQPRILFGGRVIDLTSDKVLYEQGADRPLIPASNMKLVIMAAAIDQFGEDYQFTTILGHLGSDLVVIGGGDPTIGDEKLAQRRGESITALFHRWAAKLKAEGLTEIPGDLVIDDYLFDRRFVHGNWPPGQYEAWYEAPVGALNFNANCVDVLVAPAGPAASVRLIPGNTYLDILNQASSGRKHAPSVIRKKDADLLLVRGSVARPARLGPISIRDPGMYFGHVLKTVLASEGIRLRGAVVRRRVRDHHNGAPIDCRILDVHTAPLADALDRCGKDSLGMMAESLLKLLGAHGESTGSWESGRAAVAAYLKKAGADPAQFHVDDGSGLSRQNRLSAAAATDVLRHMFRAGTSSFDRLRKSLACAGVDGTLRKRMRSPDVRGRVFAKTGYINNVRTLAGYVRTPSGRWLAFAFFYNGAINTRLLSDLQDEACRLLATSSDPP